MGLLIAAFLLFFAVIILIAHRRALALRMIPRKPFMFSMYPRD